MPTYCEPWPGNRNPTLPGVGRADRQVGAVGRADGPVAQRERTVELGAQVGDRRGDDRQPGRCRRVEVRLAASGQLGQVIAGQPGPQLLSRRAARQQQLRRNGTLPAGGRLPAYSSIVTWKLVPPNPKLDTAARRGWSGEAIQGRAVVLR